MSDSELMRIVRVREKLVNRLIEHDSEATVKDYSEALQNTALISFLEREEIIKERAKIFS